MADRTDDITDLRSRVEALELWRATAGNTAPVTRDRTEDAPESSDSLVVRATDAIIKASSAYGTADEQAVTAILAVANWLDQQELHVAATRLRMEVG